MSSEIMQETTPLVECSAFHRGMSVLEASLRNTEDSDAIISCLLKGAAEFYGASRASVVEADWDLGIGVITYEWCKDGVSAQRDMLQCLPMEKFPRWRKALRANKPVVISDLQRLEKVYPDEAAFFREYGVTTLLAAPFSKRINQGFIAVDDPTRYTDDPVFLFIASYAVVVELNEIKQQQSLLAATKASKYCRVSTKEEDQANSYEVQKEYYTDQIMSNTAWTMAGIFADKGITGTSAKKREDFMRMIRHCRQKKIDVILTKSVSRFSRNTVDCLYYIRALKQLGIAVIFEKENINSLEEDSELRITLSGAFAQSESESISANVTWGKRRAMEAGKVSIQYKKLYGYRKGEDGQPEIIPEQAEIVRWLYERYLTGASLRMIKEELEQQGVKCFEDSPEWTISRIRSILQNEKYCGDVLMQKTFRQDFINRKAIKNTGQLPMYLIENHHEGIVSREKYDAVQAEMARRNAAKSPSKNAVTGMASYASKYALSERLVCGECGTLYRRCTWTRNGEKRVVWRCVSRLDYGKKYCHNSPTLDEAPLQQAILAALNTAMADKNSLIRQITDAMETEIIPFPGGTMSLGDIECRLRVLEQQFQTLLEKATDDPAAYGGQFKEILDEQTFLKEKRSVILANNNEQAKANQRIMDAAQTLENASPYITEWDESAVRQLVETVKILSKDEVAVTLKGGIEICQKIMY